MMNRGKDVLQKELLKEFHALDIEELKEISRLNRLRGDFINLEYTFPSGQTAKLLEDDQWYWGAEVCKKGSSRCYGLAADESILLVCEYGENGSDADLILWKKRKG